MPKNNSNPVNHLLLTDEAKKYNLEIGSPSLPKEILAEALSYLTLSELMILTRVSKPFKGFVENLQIDNNSISKIRSVLAHDNKGEFYKKLSEKMGLKGVSKIIKGEFLSEEKINILMDLINRNEYEILGDLFLKYLKHHKPSEDLINRKADAIFDLIRAAVHQAKVQCLQAIIQGLVSSQIIAKISKEKQRFLNPILTYIVEQDSACMGPMKPLAAQEDHFKLIKPLHQFDLDISEALDLALEKDNQRAVELLLEKYNPNNNFSSLKCAIFYCNTVPLEYLIKKGANVNQEDANKITPMHVAADVLNIEAIKLLLDKGASTEVQSITLGSPVDIVRNRRNSDPSLEDKCLEIESVLEQGAAKQILDQINRSIGLSKAWKLHYAAQAAYCELAPNEVEVFSKYPLKPMEIKKIGGKNCMFLNQVTKKTVLKIQVEVEAQIALTSANQAADLKQKETADSLLSAINFENRYMFYREDQTCEDKVSEEGKNQASGHGY